MHVKGTYGHGHTCILGVRMGVVAWVYGSCVHPRCQFIYMGAMSFVAS